VPAKVAQANAATQITRKRDLQTFQESREDFSYALDRVQLYSAFLQGETAFRSEEARAVARIADQDAVQRRQEDYDRGDNPRRAQERDSTTVRRSIASRAGDLSGGMVGF
jgi:hypothetical protein